LNLCGGLVRPFLFNFTAEDVTAEDVPIEAWEKMSAVDTVVTFRLTVDWDR